MRQKNLSTVFRVKNDVLFRISIFLGVLLNCFALFEWFGATFLLYDCLHDNAAIVSFATGQLWYIMSYTLILCIIIPSKGHNTFITITVLVLFVNILSCIHLLSNIEMYIQKPWSVFANYICFVQNINVLYMPVYGLFRFIGFIKKNLRFD